MSPPSSNPFGHFLGGVSGTGTLTGPGHLPLAVLVPVIRPDASRWVLVEEVVGLPLVVVVPARRPEASRYWVLVVPAPPLVREVALP